MIPAVVAKPEGLLLTRAKPTKPHELLSCLLVREPAPAASVPKPRVHATSKLSITPTLTAGVQVCAILGWTGQGEPSWPGMVVSSRKSDITRRIRSSRSEVDMRLTFSQRVSRNGRNERGCTTPNGRASSRNRNVVRLPFDCGRAGQSGDRRDGPSRIVRAATASLEFACATSTATCFKVCGTQQRKDLIIYQRCQVRSDRGFCVVKPCYFPPA
jgi:hypothetical protein